MIPEDVADSARLRFRVQHLDGSQTCSPAFAAAVVSNSNVLASIGSPSACTSE